MYRSDRAERSAEHARSILGVVIHGGGIGLQPHDDAERENLPLVHRRLGRLEPHGVGQPARGYGERRHGRRAGPRNQSDGRQRGLVGDRDTERKRDRPPILSRTAEIGSSANRNVLKVDFEKGS